MADLASVKLTKRAVDGAAPQANRYRLWDSELKGFGLRVMPSGSKVYFVAYRAGGGRSGAQRDYTIGRHGELTPEQARTEAARVLGNARLGADPQRDRMASRAEATVADLCDLYLREGVALKKASTLAADRCRIDSHIKPLLGSRPVSTVTSVDIERFMADVAKGKTRVARKATAAEHRAACRRARQNGEAPPVIARRQLGDGMATGGKGTASRTVGLLGGIFTFAVKRRMRTDNPVKGVARFKDKTNQRFLSGEELARLGAALAALQSEAVNGQGLAVIRLLTLTGARKGEIEGLRWCEVDAAHSCLRLADSKTGEKVLPLGAPALAVLQSIERKASAEFVFPASKPAKPGKPAASYVGTQRVWAKVRKAAALPDVRLHDLRHTYASLAAGGGQSLPIIGAILGHRDVKTTAQYAHLADDPVKAAADRVSQLAASAMSGVSATVVPLHQSRRAG